MVDCQRVFKELGLQVLERGWLSSNNVLFQAKADCPATIVDTGYDTHAEQTLQLVVDALGEPGIQRVLNTHLHSDHCGGNHILQLNADVETWVPESSFNAAKAWDAELLSYEVTGQRCRPFRVDRALHAGQEIQLSGATWRILGAPGHDPDAVMFFQADSRVLIAGDALWEQRLAIIFPELAGEAGFVHARAVLDTIERLEPAIVIPGHGPAFTDVAMALGSSRQRLAAFEREPLKHLLYAERALAMFKMLESQSLARDAFVAWMATTPIFLQGIATYRPALDQPFERAAMTVDRLVSDGLLERDGELVRVPSQ